MIEVCLTNFNIFSKKCVNVNGSPLYKASKYLLAVLTNWEITSSASYYQVSEKYYWTWRVASDTHVARGTCNLHAVVKYIDQHVLHVTLILFSQLSRHRVLVMMYSVSACGIQTLFWIIVIFIVFFDFSLCKFIQFSIGHAYSC